MRFTEGCSVDMNTSVQVPAAGNAAAARRTECLGGFWRMVDRL